tara:strand:- start:575 stop:751 length:177 start_codon:yes stop_codon:yes gene_type:complete
MILLNSKGAIMDLYDLFEIKDLAEARQERLVKYYLKELKTIKAEIQWCNHEIDKINKE